MSVVIVGGNECMERQYKNICKEYNCDAKVYTKARGGLKNKIGSPDLLVVFTSTVSHKMLQCALSEAKGTSAKIIHAKSSSSAALKNILEEHAC